MGTWTVPQAAAPGNLSANVAPASGAGLNQSFLFQYSDPKGWQDIKVADVLFNSPFSAMAACYAMYYPDRNALYLTADSGLAWSGPITLGRPGTVQNRQCTIDGGSSSAWGSGTTLNLNLQITFQPGFTGINTPGVDAARMQAISPLPFYALS